MTEEEFNAEAQRRKPDLHRLLPSSPDAEAGLLCSFLLAPKEVGGLLVEQRITPEHFSVPANATVCRELLRMWEDNLPIDFIALTQQLRDRNLLDECGGAARVTELFTLIPTSANSAFYSGILDEKFTLREIIRVCTEYAARSYEEQHEVQTLLDELESKVLKIRSYKNTRATGMKELMMEVINHFDAIYERKGSITGISTGLNDLDRKTDGLHPEELIVIAALPSHGKTSLALNIADHIAVELNLPTAFFSLEMSAEQLGSRLLCSRARINSFRFRDGFISERDFPAMTAAAARLAAAPMIIDYASDMTIQELRARLRRLVHEKGIRVAFIDYLQLARSNTKRAGENRQIEISEISGGLKHAAKELGIPIVVLAQIDRSVDKTRRKPRLSDLRESASIEQNADAVLFLTQEEMYADNEEDRKQVEGKATLDIAKNRNGPRGEVPLTFIKEVTRFETRAREVSEEERQPEFGI